MLYSLLVVLQGDGRSFLVEVHGNESTLLKVFEVNQIVSFTFQ